MKIFPHGYFVCKFPPTELLSSNFYKKTLTLKKRMFLSGYSSYFKYSSFSTNVLDQLILKKDLLMGISLSKMVFPQYNRGRCIQEQWPESMNTGCRCSSLKLEFQVNNAVFTNVSSNIEVNTNLDIMSQHSSGIESTFSSIKNKYTSYGLFCFIIHLRISAYLENSELSECSPVKKGPSTSLLCEMCGEKIR